MYCTRSKNDLVVYNEETKQVTCRLPLEVADIYHISQLDGGNFFLGTTGPMKLCYAISKEGLALRVVAGQSTVKWQCYNTDVYDIGYSVLRPDGYVGKSKILLREAYPLPSFKDDLRGTVEALLTHYRESLAT